MGELKETLLVVCIHLCLSIKASETCTPPQCLICDRNISDALDLCPQSNQSCCNDPPAHCKKDFNVTLKTSSTKVNKREDVTVVCVSDLPRANISFRWIVNQNLLENEHNETLQILKIKENKDVTCNISSICGNFFASTTVTLKDSNDTVIIIICVVAAFLLLVTFAVVMRIIQSKGQAQRDARKRQRDQNIQNIHSTATTVTNYW